MIDSPEQALSPASGPSPDRRRFLKLISAFGIDRWIELFLALGIFAVTASQCSISKDQWKAMIESNKITRDGYSAGNRAFITANSYDLVNYGQHDPDDKDNANPIWIITPRIENTGNTPTRYLNFSSDTGLGAKPMSAETFDKLSPYNERFSSAVIGPKASVNGAIFLIRPPMLNQLVKRQAFVGTTGVVRYEDVFGEKHLTEFCFVAQLLPINFSTFPAGQPIRVGGIPCDRHNCSDAECGPDWEKRAAGKS
ncbi:MULTISPECIES: hypothetical protein [unclassified Bradyrhizobium]|uniref:hypothetical protein n=1 Tax=unclassified Bradyrhizobium TaxID=2631580 RepID=UPI0029162401|nr:MULTISPECIES: hypothetical protein [unclassified Bradyrhizobium]